MSYFVSGMTTHKTQVSLTNELLFIRDDYMLNPVSLTNELLHIRDDYMLNLVSLRNELLCIRDDCTR